jgi:hypothetical protein
MFVFKLALLLVAHGTSMDADHGQHAGFIMPFWNLE